MPFTPSHAVIALPFVRTPLVPAAIAIGAMTPDLPLFLRGFGVSYSFTHTLANVLWTAVIAAVLFLVWRAVLRPAVPELSPTWLARRLPADWDRGPATSLRKALGAGESRWYAPMLALSLLVGVASHILWDLCTHAGRGGVELLPVLGEQWGPLPGFKWLQHGSSVLGLALLGAWALLWLRGRRPADTDVRSMPDGVRIGWWLSLPVFLVGAWLIGIAAYGPFTSDFTAQHLAYRVLPPACGLWGAVTLLLCVLVHVSRRGRR